MTTRQSEQQPDAVAPEPIAGKAIKCVVWDLDNTLWDGVLLEGDRVLLRQNVMEIIKTLDGWGILQSIASKNEEDEAMKMLRELGAGDYFLYPQISWSSKVSSIENIAQALNIGLDSIAFIDDQPYERAEVSHSLPDVRCFDAADLVGFMATPGLKPLVVTQDAAVRRLMYIGEAQRKQAEEEFSGPQEEFLAGLGMVCTISAAREDDLRRAEELTVRTNQLNATGYTYSYEELDYFRCSPQHRLLIAGLEDKFGSYGKIGLVLLECQPDVWTIKLLLMSCRVMSRGVGSLMLQHIMRLAQEQQVRLRAEFVSTGRNRMMYVTYKFARFKEVSTDGGLTILENDLTQLTPFPEYVRVNIED